MGVANWINRMKGAATEMTEKINFLNEKINFLNENINCLNEKINFLNESLLAFKQRVHTDIQLKPGCEGPCKPAHRDLLVNVSRWLVR